MNNIITILEQAPALLEAENAKVIEAEKQLKLTRAKLAATRSAYTLKWQDAKNAAILDAHVESEEEVQRLVLEEIEKETQVKILRNKANRIEADWISARKLGGMTSEDLQAAANGISILGHAS